MSLLRTLTILGGVLVMASAVLAQEQKPRQAQRPQVRPGVAGPLVPAGIDDKLKLTAEQKERISKIEAEFADKTKDTEAKIKEITQKARQDKDRAGLQKAKELMDEVGKTRDTYLAKVTALLNAEQKKVLEQARAAGGRPAKPGVRPGAGATPFLLPAVRERLNLTPEQNEKLDKLQKEFEAKALQVLTDEQRKQYEQFKTRRPQQQKPRQRQTEAAPKVSELFAYGSRRTMA
jgi:Spy/CpxP family protein refolding chaperone